jgi:glucose-1-phosphate adenylyltransferase
VGPTAQIHRSLISHGCVISGTVVNSVLSPGVRVEVGAVVRDSIVMFDAVIRVGAVVDRAILDKEVVVGQGAIVGEGPDLDTPNREEPGRLNTGITVVGKRAIIPRGTRIGRNVKVAGETRAADFPGRVIRTGTSVERPGDRPFSDRSVIRSRRAADGSGSAPTPSGAGEGRAEP